jgi:hypothetical protein
MCGGQFLLENHKTFCPNFIYTYRKSCSPVQLKPRIYKKIIVIKPAYIVHSYLRRVQSLRVYSQGIKLSRLAITRHLLIEGFYHHISLTDSNDKGYRWILAWLSVQGKVSNSWKIFPNLCHLNLCCIVKLAKFDIV